MVESGCKHVSFSRMELELVLVDEWVRTGSAFDTHRKQRRGGVTRAMSTNTIIGGQLCVCVCVCMYARFPYDEISSIQKQDQTSTDQYWTACESIRSRSCTLTLSLSLLPLSLSYLHIKASTHVHTNRHTCLHTAVDTDTETDWWKRKEVMVLASRSYGYVVLAKVTLPGT